MASLVAKQRTELGKKVRALRRAGFLPGVVYGEKVLSQPVSVLMSDFVKLFREVGESTIFTLNVAGGKEYDVLIYDVKFDPLKDIPQHVDFYAVSADRAIRHNIPFEFVGESPAVKNAGGILVKVMHEIEAEALPRDLPHAFEIPLARLENINDKIYVRDITPPAGVKIHGRADDVVALVEPPRTEEELKAMDEALATAEVAEVKTEKEVKAEEKAKEEMEEDAPKE